MEPSASGEGLGAQLTGQLIAAAKDAWPDPAAKGSRSSKRSAKNSLGNMTRAAPGKQGMNVAPIHWCSRA